MRRALPVVLLLSVTLAATAVVSATRNTAAALVVHEWGTFTTVAGEDGQAMPWVPLGGPNDLPCFVECFKSRDVKVLLSNEGEPPLDYEAARKTLIATVRMETPVLYFYSPEDLSVNVRVRFPRGLITEWFPTATPMQPSVLSSSLADPNFVGGVNWPSVQILPNAKPAFPRGGGQSHYYAARETDASPVRVNGQDEKFLFYRGVASFPSVISARLEASGDVRLANLGTRPIGSVIYFENRAGVLSYRVGGTLATTATISRPTSAATFAALRADLEKILVETGLYKREAEAMVETWRDSWFEEGSRIFYVVPPGSVDEILPLAIAPAPAQVARAFVGRVELVTPDALLLVQTAIAANDMTTVERFGRFFGPIADRLASRMSSVSDRLRLRALANRMFAAYVTKASTCQK